MKIADIPRSIYMPQWSERLWGQRPRAQSPTKHRTMKWQDTSFLVQISKEKCTETVCKQQYAPWLCAWRVQTCGSELAGRSTLTYGCAKRWQYGLYLFVYDLSRQIADMTLENASDSFSLSPDKIQDSPFVCTCSWTYLFDLATVQITVENEKWLYMLRGGLCHSLEF